ncbi:MAG: hypothetical protein RBT24_02055 [Arcobacteraceae bacterium]|nr:hypothetical protein [Arcobacteraceae bacterium]
MTIYIYGSKSFKNNIQEVLEHANMKFRLSDEDSIVELSALRQLKEAIEEDPKNIFLIDDEKIIKKNSLNDKIKFLKPKDGIEEEFLKEHGIGDLSVDDIHDIATHIIKKLEKAHELKESLKEEYVQKQDSDIALKNSEYAFVHTPLKEEKQEEKIDQIKVESEEELSTNTSLYDHDEDDDFDIDDVIDFDDEEEQTKNQAEEETPEITSVNESNDEINLQEEDFGLTVEKIEQKGENSMSDEFSELDSLNEDELLEALNGSSTKNSSKTTNQSTKKTGAEVELNSNSIHEISSLITQLLNNKTLEITIKIKE